MALYTILGYKKLKEKISDIEEISIIQNTSSQFSNSLSITYFLQRFLLKLVYYFYVIDQKCFQWVQ